MTDGRWTVVLAVATPPLVVGAALMRAGDRMVGWAVRYLDRAGAL